MDVVLYLQQPAISLVKLGVTTELTRWVWTTRSSFKQDLPVFQILLWYWIFFIQFLVRIQDWHLSLWTGIQWEICRLFNLCDSQPGFALWSNHARLCTSWRSSNGGGVGDL